MNPDPTPEAAASPLQAAVEEVRVGVQHLIKLVDDGALTELGANGLIGFLQDWEQVRNTLPVIDRAAIQYGTENDVPKVCTQRSMTQVLVDALRLSPAEARRRVKAAEHLADRRSMLGEPLPAIRPCLAAAQRDGLITPEQVTIIDDALRRVDRCDPVEVADGEQILVQAATQLGPVELRPLAEKVVDAIDPDGILPDEAEQRRRRHFRLAPRPDGSWVGEFRLTPEAGRKLKELLDPLTKPATLSHDTDRATASGKPSMKFVDTDDRSLGQRRHDALETILDRLLRHGDNPEHGGTPATVIVTISYDDFLTQLGAATLADGTPLSVRLALAVAEQAEIAWCFLDARGAVLDLYRTRRIASKDQTIALYARDGGCSFPGCGVEPSWCERHHVISWWDGGDTNLANLTLLCTYHHHHFAERGWTCQMIDGLPWWTPPKWIDPEQKPRLHPRIKIANWHHQDPLNL